MSTTATYCSDMLDVENVVICPVCLDIPKKEIYMCRVGHHICDSCRNRLTLCPTCQASMTNTRNFLAESLVSIFKDLRSFNISNEERNNTNAPVISAEIKSNCLKLEDNRNRLKPQPSPPGIYRCLLESCKERKTGIQGDIYQHIVKKHSHLYDKFQNESATFSHKFENFCLIKNRRKFHRCFQVSNMGLFFFNLQMLNDHYINCWLSMPVPVSTANNFYCQFVFTKENDDAKTSLINKVASNLQDEGWLLERGRVFVLSPFEHTLKNNDFFSVSVKVVYRPPNEKAIFC